MVFTVHRPYITDSIVNTSQRATKSISNLAIVAKHLSTSFQLSLKVSTPIPSPRGRRKKRLEVAEVNSELGPEFILSYLKREDIRLGINHTLYSALRAKTKSQKVDL